MNILITDDERLVRFNLMSMLEELYPGEHCMDEARDGKEMADMVASKYYDVVFLDINMPKKNGLDALELCLKLSPETEWCILTGYAEFAYAKRAISLGVKGYLLKPLDLEELKALMDGIISGKEETRRRKHQLFASGMNQAFALADTTGVQKQMYPRKGASYSLYLYFLDMAENTGRQELYAKLYEELSGYLSKHVETQDQYALFFLPSGELCLVLEGKEYEGLRSWLKRYAALFDGSANITAIWTRAGDFKELYMDKQIALGISPMRILEKNYTTISLGELSGKERLMEKQFFCEKMETLTAGYVTANYNMAGELLREIEREERLGKIFSQIDQKAFLSYLSVIWKERFEERDWRELLKHLQRLLERSKRADYEERGDMIARIREYVYDNYMNDVTIAELGQRFDISPSYISRIFREKTGEKYIDFVTSVRMEKAMELLRTEPMLSVKNVSERVGYVSEKHFSKTFKKYFNRLPSQVGE